MSRIVVVDIDNCIANVNKALKDKGYRTDIYPSPVPSRLFDDGSIFKNAEPMKSVIENIEGIIDNGLMNTHPSLFRFTLQTECRRVK